MNTKINFFKLTTLGIKLLTLGLQVQVTSTTFKTNSRSKHCRHYFINTDKVIQEVLERYNISLIS